VTDERPADPTPEQPTEAVGGDPTGESPGPDAAGTAGETGETGEQTSTWSTSSTSGEGVDPESAGAKMVSQLQAMIDSIATQATPVAKQIGLKAAELTAAAADRAGPIAHRAGDVAADASGKLAVRSREFADAIRRELGAPENGTSAATDDATDAGATDPSSTTTAILDRPVDEVVDEVNARADDAS
jgi:hypothetical protein